MSNGKLKKTEMPTVFEYLDFRSFMRDMYTFKKGAVQAVFISLFCSQGGFFLSEFSQACD